MTEHWARPVALGVIRVGDEVLVVRGHDRVKDETYFRPLGGTIEFGERAVDAVRRELREELGVGVTSSELLGVFENVFVVENRPGHEIDFVFDVSIRELDRLRSDAIVASEADGKAMTCMWMSLAEFRAGARLYPPGLLAVLEGPTGKGGTTARSPVRPEALAAPALGAAVVIAERGRVLLVRHNYGHHNWEVPGGISEPGESVAQTALREVREELGLRIELTRLTGIYWEPTWGDGRGMHHFVFAGLRPPASEPSAADPKEISDWGWFAPAQLPRPISDFTTRRVTEALGGSWPAVTLVPLRIWLE